MKKITQLITLAALLLPALHVWAGEKDHHHDHAAMEENSLYKGVFSSLYGREADKLVALAKTFNSDQMKWSPMEGVYTTREVILHVASANYFIGSILGKPIPEGIDPRAFSESIHDGNEVIQTLEASIGFAQEAVAALDPKDLGTKVEFFGQEMSKMAVATIVAGHTFEHLGQLIAYARSNEIVPPWSRPQTEE